MIFLRKTLMFQNIFIEQLQIRKTPIKFLIALIVSSYIILPKTGKVWVN